MADRRLLRCELVSPAHLGGAGGLATLDRPTQLDAQTGLPYLPDTALKGVLAGRFGDVPSEEGRANRTRERLFGSPDRGETEGQPGPVVLGNGELLSWPVPTRDGSRAWVVPATAVARALDLEPGHREETSEVLDLLVAVEAVDKQRRALGLPRVPAVAGVEPVRSFRDRTVEASSALGGLLAGYLGRRLNPAASIVVVGEELARQLWRAASERRTSTALDSARKVVASGSLRTVEVVPEGSVFLSLLTYHGRVSEERLFDGLVQIGAYESQGLGWVRLSLVEGEAGATALGATDDSPEAEPVRLRTAEVMVSTWRAVETLAADAPAKVVATVRAAIGGFGMRTHRQGLAATLAFELAKARPADRRPTAEARAHRWLLGQVLGLEGEPVSDTGEDRALKDWLEQAPFAGDWMDRHRELMELRWLWLRRYAEAVLGPVESGGAE